jgi:hypothetical protein
VDDQPALAASGEKLSDAAETIAEAALNVELDIRLEVEDRGFEPDGAGSPSAAGAARPAGAAGAAVGAAPAVAACRSEWIVLLAWIPVLAMPAWLTGIRAGWIDVDAVAPRDGKDRAGADGQLAVGDNLERTATGAADRAPNAVSAISAHATVAASPPCPAGIVRINLSVRRGGAATAAATTAISCLGAAAATTTSATTAAAAAGDETCVERRVLTWLARGTRLCP